jgi:hypothetical protein
MNLKQTRKKLFINKKKKVMNNDFIFICLREQNMRKYIERMLLLLKYKIIAD